MADATLEQIQSLLSVAAQRLDQVSQQQQSFRGEVSELGIHIEELATVQANAQRQIEASQHRIEAQISDLATLQADSQRRIEAQIEASLSQLNALTQAQGRTQQQLDALTVRVQAVSDRVDSFVSVSQHYFGQHGERLAKLEGITERLEGILSYLVRKDDRQRG